MDAVFTSQVPSGSICEGFWVTTGCSLHGRTKVSPVLLQHGQVVPDLLLLLHQLIFLGLQSLGVGLHSVLTVLALLCICTKKIQRH